MKKSRAYAEGYTEGRATSVKKRVHNLMISLSEWMTADEMAEKLGLSVLAVRPEVCHLHKEGLIEKTGQKRTSVTGMPAHVWRLV